MFKIVEKKNPFALHALCDTKQGAERWLKELAPVYCERGYYTDKTLTPDSFEIKPAKD